MKVVRIIARLNVGGPAKHVVWLTAELRDLGCEALLVAGVVPPGEDDMGYFAKENNVEPIIISEMSREISPKDVLTIWRLYRLLVRERPDIVHTHTAKAGTVGRVAGMLYRYCTLSTLIGRPRRCRFVHTYHGHVFHSYYSAFKTRIFLTIERALARLATNKIIVLSRQQFDEIHNKFRIGRTDQFAIVPLGLDLSIFTNWQQRRPTMRDELNAGPDDVLVGIVGRLTEIKNHSLFLEAVARFKDKVGIKKGEGRIRFVVIGDGHLREKLEAQALQLGLAEDVIFAGTRNHPEVFYPALDVVALTSFNEGTPLTLIEAMANARAVISTAVGGVVDLLGEKLSADDLSGAEKLSKGFEICERGVRVRPNDAETFQEGLAYLLASDEVRRTMAERGRRFIEENFSKERLIRDVVALYRDLSQEAHAIDLQNPKPQVKNGSSVDARL